MRIFTFFIFSTLLFLTEVTLSQTKMVSGKVTALDDGLPMPGVTVQVKGAKTGTATSQDGTYRINADENDVLVFTAIGYARQEITVGTKTQINVSLSTDTKELGEVVVTALGIKRERRSLGYSVQEVRSEELTRSRDENIVNALQGKVAGVNIQSSGGAPGAGASIIIRGITSLSPTANNQPLFVVDGIPISNETIAGNVLPSAGTNSQGSEEQFSFTNRAADINPQDIESVSILKGPAATALYGLRAGNGAVIITTKSGTSTSKVNFSTSLSLDNVVKVPEIQTTYREGLGGRAGRLNSDGTPNRFQTFGPTLGPNDKIYNNFKDYFQTGVRFTNSISVSGGNEKSNYYTSASDLDQKGIAPGSDYRRTTLKLSGSTKVSDKFSVNASANYSISGGARPSAGDKGVMTDLYYHTTTADVNDYIYPDGSMKSYAPGIVDNPVYAGIYSTLTDKVNRLIGNTGFNYTVNNWLKIDYKIGGDFYSDSRTRTVPGPRFAGDATTLDLALGTGGFIVEDRINFREINSNLFVTASKDFNSDWSGSILVGNNVFSQRTDQVNTRGERFGQPFFYDLSNTANLYSFRDETKRSLFGLFADATIGYKDAVFLNVTGRNDWTSTLPKDSRSFFYPSVNLSYVFSDMHNLTSDVFSYGKLKASVASVGKDASPYSNGPYFSLYTGFPFNGISGFARTSTLSDPNLKPERTTSIELGTELRFLKNRIGLDLSVYQADSRDQIIPVQVSYTSGYTNYITNSGEIRNKGVEVLLTGKPVSNKSFSWDMSLNWTVNRGEVLSIKEGINELVFSPIFPAGNRVVNKLVVGGSAGDLYGLKFQRNAAGQLIINANGFPTVGTTMEKVGNAFPDWQGGLTNTFSYKGLSLSTLLEFRKGGDVHDVSLRNAIRNGVAKVTEHRYEQVIFNGVKADGSPNTTPVNIDESFYRTDTFFPASAEALLQDASWFRLRNVTLSYALPKKFIAKSGFVKGLTLSAIGNNFILWTAYKGYDPEGSAYGSGSNAFGYTGSNLPSKQNFTFSINANF